MTEPAPEHLTTRELAARLRLSERKIYDLAAQGEVPCVRLVGKLLFPRAEIDAWIAAARSGPVAPAPLPPIVAGSHDPLLDWALRDSGAGLAGYFDGSHDGLDRLSARQAQAAGLHIREAEDWNVAAVAARCGALPVTLIEVARRRRGLLTAPGNPLGLAGPGDLAGRRVARRQESAASHAMLDTALAQAGLSLADLPGPDRPARSEEDVAAMIREGAADAGLGLQSVAAASGLGFVPLFWERYDLAVWRQAAFDPPLRTLLGFLAGAEARARAAAMTGYDLSDAGRVRWNAPVP
ncbi:helix-turn-helix domain-containing protein [Rhodobacteraceae bacterium CCMM004]|nr:helix-turn-helix domain-containing protein [Rhodobacteraceae bacterium CCMM004]